MALAPARSPHRIRMLQVYDLMGKTFVDIVFGFIFIIVGVALATTLALAIVIVGFIGVPLATTLALVLTMVIVPWH